MSAPPSLSPPGEPADTTERRLVPSRLVRPAAALAGVCALITIGLGVLYHGDRTGGDLDRIVRDAITSAFPRRWLLDVMVAPSEPITIFVVIGIVTLVALRHRRPRVAALAVLGPLAAVVLASIVLKPIFDRTHNGYLAFPSGHTASVVSVLTVLTIVVAAVTGPSLRKRAIWLMLFGSLVLTATVVTALVGLDYHYVTDTAGGLCSAVATVLTVALVIDRFAAGRDARFPRSTPK